MAFPVGKPFEDALVYAHRIHSGQFRKGSAVPYVAHVLAVAALALEQGASEEVAVAALLHDAVEDGGGLPVLEEIRSLFGPTVADLVEACSDSFTTPKRPWRERKEGYLARLAQEASAETRLIVVCDKLHNVTGLVRSCRLEGPGVWARFNGGPGETVWFYQSVAEILDRTGDVPLVEDLKAAVAELAACVP